ncbi:SRPBCC family protein [Deinococcus radiophilus]|uniref:Cyclase n=1 Tax=Deinococcus radiophilus TaxID=32062 RepID=A0A431VR39_9DEIO|nr:SRPBCC family protein [Deinococcus radiophilus]RTR25604.1 cyclase [Deinococcus radiophilus]UFA51680.1 SRPBCC family protein [Deinococcus radiophilus]
MNTKAVPEQELPGAQLLPTERTALGVLGSALLLSGLGQRGVGRLVLMGLGSGLGYMAAKGRNPLATALKIQQNDSGEVMVREAVTIGRPVDEIYAQWRDLPNLPRIMSHLERVELLQGNRSCWTAKAPAPLNQVTWEAELTADEPGQRIAWQSLPGSQIENSGEVLFREAPGGRGTEVVARLSYRPPGGSFGAIAARIMGEEPAQQLRDDLMRFKREQELGYNPTTNGQTSGRADAGERKPEPAAQPKPTSAKTQNMQKKGEQ